VSARKGQALPCASHSSEIALAGSRRMRSTLAVAPVLFAHKLLLQQTNMQIPNLYSMTSNKLHISGPYLKERMNTVSLCCMVPGSSAKYRSENDSTMREIFCASPGKRNASRNELQPAGGQANEAARASTRHARTSKQLHFFTQQSYKHDAYRSPSTIDLPPKSNVFKNSSRTAVLNCSG
jgi:hypothetical protein